MKLTPKEIAEQEDEQDAIVARVRNRINNKLVEKIVVLDIGSWDMTKIAFKKVAHGIENVDDVKKKTISCTSIIVDDKNDNISSLQGQGRAEIDAVNVTLMLLEKGKFTTSSSFKDPSVNRGTITITYYDY